MVIVPAFLPAHSLWCGAAPMTRRELAALALQSECAAHRLHARCDDMAGPVLTISRDEVRTLAERLVMLAGVAREYHTDICRREVKHG